MRIKRIFEENKQLILFTVIVNILVTLSIVVALGAYINNNQGLLFDSFATEYLREQRSTTATTSPPLFSEQSRIVDIVQAANPAVVSIVVTREVPVFEQRFRQFGPFNFRIPELRQEGTQEQEVGGGSGFFVSSDGLIITNRHVVSEQDASYTAVTSEGEQYEVDVVARGPMLDIAVLEVVDREGETFSYLEFGNSDYLQLGQTVIAIGNALAEFRNTVSVGVVSGLSRSIVAGSRLGQFERLEGVIQTDAAINPGNSGGPLLDLNGRVVGVNVAVAQGSENIGFSIPSSEVRRVVDSVEEHGEIVRPYLGVRYVPITEEVQAQNDLPVDYGALVVSGEGSTDPAVLPGSPASDAGIEAGDIILSVDGVILEDQSLARVIRTRSVGETITVTVLRDGAQLELDVTLEEAPNSF